MGQTKTTMTSLVVYYWIFFVATVFFLGLAECNQPSKHYRNSHVIFKRFSPIEIDENAPIGQLIIDLKVNNRIIESYKIRF